MRGAGNSPRLETGGSLAEFRAAGFPGLGRYAPGVLPVAERQ
jgi:hypothetical protein